MGGDLDGGCAEAGSGIAATIGVWHDGEGVKCTWREHNLMQFVGVEREWVTSSGEGAFR
jgi:hypothetical protein